MKSFLSLLLCAALLVCCGCGAAGPQAAAATQAPSPAPAAAPTAAPTEAPTQAPSEAPDADEESFSPDFTFSAVDRDGRVWDESVFAEHELTMINFWEPWCGPCVREMGDLERLYETYADRGFLILGVYSTEGMESDVDSVLASNGVGYPILRYTYEFARFETGYVPTTVFVDRTGRLVTRELTGEDFVIGSNPYDAWEAVVLSGLS